MTYRGTVQDGKVIFDTPVSLADGTPVRVEILPAPAEAPRKTPRDERPAFHPVGAWDGPPGELDRLLEDVQKERDADLELERDKWR